MNKNHKFKKAIVLLSGGLDSTTVLAIARSEKYDIYCLSFNYGQRHIAELTASKKVVKAFDVENHLIIDIDLSVFGNSALTQNIKVPKNRTKSEINNKIPVTYVPARNTIFLSYAIAWAEVLDASDIFIGVNAIDYSGYPDCRPEFINAFEHMASLATKKGVEEKHKIKIQTPLINLSKAEIIKKGIELKVDYSLTHSCYDPLYDGKACGSCDSCILRKNGFTKAGTKDPVLYAT